MSNAALTPRRSALPDVPSRQDLEALVFWLEDGISAKSRTDYRQQIRAKLETLSPRECWDLEARLHRAGVRSPDTFFVYAIRAGSGGLVKIGRAADPRSRLRELQTGSPLPLHLLAVAPETASHSENGLHRMLSAARRRGEWFELTDEQAIAAIQRERAAA